MPDPTLSMSLNRYMYVAGNPIRFTDPSGNCIPELCPGGGRGDVSVLGSWPPSGGGNRGGGRSGSGNGGGGWNVPSNQSDFYNPNHGTYSGCFKCHTAKNAGRVPTNSELEDTFQWQSNMYRQLVLSGGRMAFEPLDYAATIVECTPGPCPSDVIILTLMPFLSGGMDDIFRMTHTRVVLMGEALPARTRNHVTMAVGVAEDSSGELRYLIGTSEPNGYIRPDIEFLIRSDDIIVGGTSHAEINIVNHATENNMNLLAVEASRTMCSDCARNIKNAGATPFGPW